jgi:crotonobetainyl-CoA:carnitine CoA-transferase CaiB-like acyl-CoA transferase
MTPLESLKVVDLTDLRGALCGRMLADLGADVLRIGAVDPANVVDAYRNANKRVTPFDPATIDDLLRRADVLIENLPSAQRTELGLDPSGVRHRHPHLIHLVIADFGLSGPRAGWKLEPLTGQAAGGTLFASGFPELAPCWFPGFLAHDCGAVYGFLGTIAAVTDRARHGRGQTLEISVQEATLAGTNPWSVAISDYVKINPFLPAAGRRNADGFYFVLPAADGWVRFVIGNDKQWRGAVHLARNPEVLTTPEWLDPIYRRMNADVARLVLADALQDRTRAQLFEEARQVGATLGVIHMPGEYVSHPQPSSRGVFTEGVLPGLEGAPVVRPPLEFSATPGRTVVAGARSVSDPGWVPAAAPPAASAPASAAALPSAASGLPLEGVRVVEFGMAAVGPEAALVLSEFGADVIKVESRSHLDVLRLAGGERINCAFAFNVECRGRRSVTLNLDTVEGRRLAFELCARADVVIENFRGGVLDDMGLGYASIRASNPNVVYASSQGYGRTGPLGGMAAYGPLNLGFSGLHHLWNHTDAPYPCGTSLNHPDHVAGKFLAGGIMAALAHRDRTGEGQRVDLAQTEFAAYLRGEVYIDGWRLGADPVASGNDSITACPHGVYPTAGDDTWIAIVVASDEEWERFCEVSGWEAEDDLASLPGRLARAGEIASRLAAWTAGQDGPDLAGRLQEAGISASPVMGPLDHLDDPHLLERGFIVTLHHPEVGDERHAGNPLRMSVTRPRVAPSAPCLGAHTAEVLFEVLGIPAEETGKLVADGVCV